ncbi:MAG TPA: type II toxin-antitoxin system VapC family toxin [Quisquiliibacterium sp.]|nr:MAG: type II toxin-antitoxin system VapC family toxin [Burkholderiaceae bacterium]HOA92203.1 type II toxin-antitoxin system VapC family toxin [Quisquiliibacterium sp.]HPA88681.1 type II toxin-antitoxin system VapC family toxin [Quisquiliibacterium sp.]HQD81987.1 type II toxin-antitoxin system VapC family toxin [Quisquiliibacterium sp.]HQN10913.1 type II toxin-antitoxin system VapC family toxin [Quisquiliibacterium sp.]
MQLLLDTHVLLWALADAPTLPVNARTLLLDARNTVWVSAVSIWEIAIKHALGRGDMPISGEDALGYCRLAGYRWLDVRPEHAAAVESLPALHGDPFDRLLVAQARFEPMRLVTHDRTVASYDTSIVLV